MPGTSTIAPGTPAQTTVYRGADGKAYGSAMLGQTQSTRGQYVYDAAGNKLGMPDGEQLVLLAATTELGSSAVESLGNTLHTIRKVGDTFAQEAQAAMAECFAPLVARKVVSLDSVEVDPGHGMPSSVHVTLTDTTTQNPIEITIG